MFSLWRQVVEPGLAYATCIGDRRVEGGYNMYDLDNLSWAVQENRPEIVRRGRARVASGIDQRLSYITRRNSIRGPAV